MQRPRITFAGVTFAGYQHGPGHITVPVSALKKLLRARLVRPHLSFDIEHDGDGRGDCYNQDIEKVAEWCDRQTERLENHYRRPWLLYYSPTEDVIHYCPHSNLSNILTPAASN